MEPAQQAARPVPLRRDRFPATAGTQSTACAAGPRLRRGTAVQRYRYGLLAAITPLPPAPEKGRGRTHATRPRQGRYRFMDPSLSRRGLIAAGLFLPLLALPGCATRLGDIAN